VARIGVAATAPFGADVLERLAARHDVAFLLTRPDRPRGRGRKVAPPAAKLAADRLGLPVLQPERLDASVKLPAETIVVVAYGLLVPPDVLERHLWLNVHPSLLPRWRGAAPVERAIMAGDGGTGVTIIRLVEELDAGPIGAQEAFAIGPDDDAGAVYDRAAEVAARLLEPLPRRFSPQPAEGATYAEKITAADRPLDLSRPAGELVRQVRALSPHIGARAELQGRDVIVWRARVGADGSFEPLQVQPEGSRSMEFAAWLRGLR
jgi:methionyl-tRNA formyltransferase